MQGRNFFLGLTTGAALVAVVAFVFGPSGDRGPVFAGLRDAADAGSGDEGLATDDPTALRLEIARLRTELERARSGADRTPVGTGAGNADDEADENIEARSTEVDVVPADRAVDEMLAELDELIRSGALHRKFRENPEELAGFLVQAWTEADQPERALLLMQRFDLTAELGGWGSWIGRMLREKGDSERATEAFLMGMRSSPTDWDVVTQLAEIAPEAALREQALLLASGGMEEDGDAVAQRAMLLLATDDREAALAAIDAILAQGALPDLLWEQLLQRDPAAAEERLRGRLGVAEADENSAVRLRMVQALHNQGRGEEARREIDTMLRDHPEDASVVEALAEMDSAAALQHLRQRVTQAPSPGSWGLYGEHLLRGERTEEATTAFWQAWELAPNDGYQYRLLELAPLRIAPRLVEQASANNDDELFGDIADALWQAERRIDARRYWARALDIDPTDSEWISKLRAVDAGRDPFQ